MGLFNNKKKSVSRSEMRTALRRSTIARPGTGGKKYTRKERIAFEKKLFPRGYGGQISKGEYGSALDDMKKSKTGKSFGKRREIQREINALKKFGGK